MARVRLTALLLVLVPALPAAGCGGGDVSTTTVPTTTAAPTTSAPTTTSTTPTTAPVTTTQATTTTTTTLVGIALQWARADAGGALAGPGLQVVLDIAVGGPGFVAVGGEDLDGDTDAAVWLSADGYTWEQVPHDEAAFGGPGIQWMNGVTVGGPGLVAVGIDDPEGSHAVGFMDPDAAVWVSADGYAWERIPHDETLFGGPEGQRMMNVAAAGPGLVAIGSDYQDGSSWPDGAVWVSPDGYAWERVDDPAIFGGAGGQEILGVAAGGPGVVAVGSADSYAKAAVWVSADGYTWERIPHDVDLFSFSEMKTVMAAGPGLVAVGTWLRGGHNIAAWVSADGYAWERIEDADLVGPGQQEAAAFATWSEGVAVLGQDDFGPEPSWAFWTSADGYEWSRTPIDSAAFGSVDDTQISAMAPWGSETGLIVLAGDLSTDDWNGAVWVGVPPEE